MLKSLIMEPIFTIVIPTFQRDELLLQTINSLRFSPHIGEIIIINDDPSRSLVLKIEKVIAYNPGVNLGESGAINLGWSKASFPYVIVISDDDPQPANLFEEIAKVIESNQNSLVFYPNLIECNSEGIIRTTKVSKFSAHDFYGLLRCPCLAGVAINRKLLEALKITDIRRTKIDFPSDLIQWLELSKFGTFIPVPLGFSNWWRHEHQMTRNLGEFKRAKLFFDHVTTWFRDNPRFIQDSTFWAIFLRSMQLLGLDIFTFKGLKLLRTCFTETYSTYLIQKIRHTKIIYLLALTVLKFTILKLQHDR
jgi:glycosyltransferase involved in cell wall biosynthesis